MCTALHVLLLPKSYIHWPLPLPLQSSCSELSVFQATLLNKILTEIQSWFLCCAFIFFKSTALYLSLYSYFFSFVSPKFAQRYISITQRLNLPWIYFYLSSYDGFVYKSGMKIKICYPSPRFPSPGQQWLPLLSFLNIWTSSHKDPFLLSPITVSLMSRHPIQHS